MVEIKEIDQKQSHLVNQLVSDAFQYVAPHQFFHDFPIWGSSQVLRLGIFEGQNLVSHVGIRFTKMHTQTKSESIALIGAVATSASHRGKGLSTNLLKEALRIIDERNCNWSFLWGSEHAFYGKLGFKLQGEQGRAPLSALVLDPKGIITTDIKLGMTEAIFTHLKSEKNGIQFQESDREWVWKHKTVKWFHLENPFAFIAYERGMDLKHIVHEMGGDQRGIEKLLYAIYVHDKDAEIIGTPEQLLKFGFKKEQLLIEYLCLARPRDSKDHWNPQFWISGLSAC
jgi:predicted N-acetyltransferase YhbS